MIPLELKVDKTGLLYIDDEKLLSNAPLLIDERNLNLDNKYYVNGFYRFNSTSEYIIKCCYTELTKDECNYYKDMLHHFNDKRDKILNTDLPIGYLKRWRKVAGLIIKYYPQAISLEKILEDDINLLSKFYSHDEDSIHNLFLLFENVLNNLWELFENDIYYTDINPGNILIDDNKVKIIDFEPVSVKFDKKTQRLKEILGFYSQLINYSLNKYQLYNPYTEVTNSFNDAKKLTRKIENRVRK